MTRERWFCCLCGALTATGFKSDGRAYCRAHDDLRVDSVPRDPLRSLPMQASELASELHNVTTGAPCIVLGRDTCGSLAQPEVVSPADGTERC